MPAAPTIDGRPPVVAVMGATGALGGEIVRALLARGVHVRALVRATSRRAGLEALGVTDFAVADLNDRAGLERALAVEPRAGAVVASAAGFTAHSARTRADNAAADTQGYRDLIDATRAAGVPRFVLISILGCDRAPGVPHFREKLDAERHLARTGQPFLALRAGAFLDRSRDVVPASLAKGRFPDILPGVPMALTYTRHLALYATAAALDVPASALNRSVDIGCDAPATGEEVAAAFTRVLGRPIRATPVFPPIVMALAPLAAPVIPRLRANLAVLRWLREGGYVSRDLGPQRELFGPPPTVAETVADYCRDKGLLSSGAPPA